MESWYAVYTKPRQEAVAEEHLTRQQFRIYLPRIRQSKRTRGRWQSVIEPLFPRYLFIQLDSNFQGSAPIRSTRGVVGLVRFGDMPQPVDNALVDGLMQMEADGGASKLFKPGDAVTIAAGPLAGLQAIYEADRGEDRVLLLLDLMGRPNRVAFSRHEVIPAI